MTTESSPLSQPLQTRHKTVPNRIVGLENTYTQLQPAEEAGHIDLGYQGEKAGWLQLHRLVPCFRAQDEPFKANSSFDSNGDADPVRVDVCLIHVARVAEHELPCRKAQDQQRADVKELVIEDTPVDQEGDTLDIQLEAGSCRSALTLTRPFVAESGTDGKQRDVHKYVDVESAEGG